MRIVINKQACIGCEICVNTCPEVFMEWGLHMRAVFEVKEPERHKTLIQKAAEHCPVRAIVVDGAGSTAEAAKREALLP